MTRRQTKWLVLFFLLVGVSAGAFFGVDYYYNKKDILTVQMGEALRQDLTQTVASTGEIKPKKSVNISSNAMGRIIRMPVKEGDRVKQGDLLISLESIQTQSGSSRVVSERWPHSPRTIRSYQGRLRRFGNPAQRCQGAPYPG